MLRDIAEQTGLSQKDVLKVLRVLYKVIRDKLEHGETINIPRVGKFYSYDYKERYVVNPRTKEKLLSKKRKTPKFKFYRKFKEDLNNIK